jgi:cytochrome oxidase Cu insertion factor (SCO1/SenC/PrrC family)
MGAPKRNLRVSDETSEQEFAELVDRAERELDGQLLVELLPERNAVYRGRSANTVNRMRGYLLAAFEHAGLPEEALPYVFEELESGRDAYLVAAAARALRGLKSRSSEAVPFLLKAIENVKYADDAVTFDRYQPSWPLSEHTTALQELAATIAWLGSEVSSALPALRSLMEEPGVLPQGARTKLELVVSELSVGGSCCAVPASPCCGHQAKPARSVIHEIRPKADAPIGVELEDQDGARVRFGDFFTGKPSVLTFFYTRCNNPNKCSLTITKLGWLQGRLADLGFDSRIRTAAISYDPEFDLPARLRAYGENRGVLFTPSNRLFRTKGALAPLEDYFTLGVSFGETLVNRHRIELFLLNQRGQVAGAFTRLQWDVEEVLAQAANLVAPACPDAGPEDHAQRP